MALNMRMIKMMYRPPPYSNDLLDRLFLRAMKRVILDTIINLQVNKIPPKTRHTTTPTTLKPTAVATTMTMTMTTMTSVIHTSSATLEGELKQTKTLHIQPNDIIHNICISSGRGER